MLKYSLKVFRDQVLKYYLKLAENKEEVDAEIYIMRTFIICALQEMLLAYLIKKGWDWQDMKHA
jgi:hypothetical protein